MSNIKLFWLREDDNEVLLGELPGEERTLDYPLRTMLERNLQTVLGIRILASNYPLPGSPDERIPTLGIDENNRPVIINYGGGTLAINQGLFYLSWLMGHRADFDLLVHLHPGIALFGTVQWHMPRLICIGERFASYALHTAASASLSVEVMRYRFHAANLLLFERLKPPLKTEDIPAETLLRLNNLLAGSDNTLKRLYLQLQQMIMGLNSDIELILRDNLIVFHRMRNVAAVQIFAGYMALYLNLSLNQISMEELAPNYINDAEGRMPPGIGRIEILLYETEQLGQILPLITRSIENG